MNLLNQLVHYWTIFIKYKSVTILILRKKILEVNKAQMQEAQPIHFPAHKELVRLKKPAYFPCTVRTREKKNPTRRGRRRFHTFQNHRLRRRRQSSPLVGSTPFSIL
jgi:hypothetical protein